MIYKDKIFSKDGNEVPVFFNNLPMHSKYNPVKEAECFGENISLDTGCLLVAGVGGGFHIDSLCKKFPHSLIICFEKDIDSLNFCLNLPLNKKLQLNDNIIFCTFDSLEKTIIENYIPSIYGSLTFLQQRAWINYNSDLLHVLNATVSKIISEIKADYSVQSHFGKIWQNNILLNLKLMENSKNYPPEYNYKTLSKTAAIIAAGPSFDKSIEKIKCSRDDYFVISTDTSFGSLLDNGIIPEAVLSVDGQFISSTHFYSCLEKIDCLKNTTFVFDICGSHTAARFLKSKGLKVFFIRSGHPLASVASNYVNLPYLNTGAGTVTIACCDFAYKCGFKNMELFGADFCYNSGKSYTKGTYLDKQYNTLSNRFCTNENSFDGLLFRTNLIKINCQSAFSGVVKSPFTSTVLDSYKTSLENWLTQNNIMHDNSLLKVKSNEMFSKCSYKIFNVKEFEKNYISNLKNMVNNFSEKFVYNKNEYLFTLLPFIAYLRGQKKYSNLTFFDLLKLAYSETVRYTYYYEKDFY